MGWIEDEAKKIKQQDERNKEQDQRKKEAKDRDIRKSKVLPGKTPALWNSLVEQCRLDTGAINKQFEGNDSRRVQFDTPSGEVFTIIKKEPPVAHARVTLQPNFDAVKIEFHRVIERGQPSSEFWTASIDMDENENIFFSSPSGGVQGISERILEPIMASMRADQT